MSHSPSCAFKSNWKCILFVIFLLKQICFVRTVTWLETSVRPSVIPSILRNICLQPFKSNMSRCVHLYLLNSHVCSFSKSSMLCMVRRQWDYCSVCIMALNDICHRFSPSGSQLFSRCESVRRAVGTRGSGFPSLHMKVNAFKALHVSVIVVWLGRRFCSVMNSYSCAQQRPAEEKSSGKIKLQHVLANADICNIAFHHWLHIIYHHISPC